MNATNARTADARAAARFAKIEKGTGNTAYKACIPGHHGKCYRVLLRWNGQHGTLTGECLVDAGQAGLLPCPSRRQAINGPCYHVMAAVIAAAGQAGKRVWICRSTEDALRVQRTQPGSRIITLQRREGGRTITIVIRGGGADDN